jgi:hypothetical protein
MVIPRLTAVQNRGEEMTIEDLRSGKVLLLTATDAARLVHKDVRTVNKSLDSKEWLSVKLGKRRMIPVKWFLEYLDGQSASGEAQNGQAA